MLFIVVFMYGPLQAYTILVFMYGPLQAYKHHSSNRTPICLDIKESGRKHDNVILRVGRFFVIVCINRTIRQYSSPLLYGALANGHPVYAAIFSLH